jgi:hypothetical protein
MTNDSETLIFLSDPERFMDLVMTDDAKTRLDGFTLFDDIALCEIVRYGVYNDENMISGMGDHFSHLGSLIQRTDDTKFARHLRLSISGFHELKFWFDLGCRQESFTQEQVQVCNRRL